MDVEQPPLGLTAPREALERAPIHDKTKALGTA
jgi:hypothetical protein